MHKLVLPPSSSLTTATLGLGPTRIFQFFFFLKKELYGDITEIIISIFFGLNIQIKTLDYKSIIRELEKLAILDTHLPYNKTNSIIEHKYYVKFKWIFLLNIAYLWLCLLDNFTSDLYNLLSLATTQCIKIITKERMNITTILPHVWCLDLLQTHSGIYNFSHM
ncbi:hypothetical protein ACJX0J_029081, partial [Zea mays]